MQTSSKAGRTNTDHIFHASQEPTLLLARSVETISMKQILISSAVKCNIFFLGIRTEFYMQLSCSSHYFLPYYTYHVEYDKNSGYGIPSQEDTQPDTAKNDNKRMHC